MALITRDKHFYGDSQADIREYLSKYSSSEYAVHHFADAFCKCGNRTFGLRIDDIEGAAVRICKACGNDHPIGDSEEFLAKAELEECECPCGQSILEITVGVSLYDGSEDVRWLYIGCRCPNCGLTGCYGDWKNEYPGYRELLARV